MPRRDNTMPPEIEGKVMDLYVVRAQAPGQICWSSKAAAAKSGMIGNDEIADGVRWIRSRS